MHCVFPFGSSHSSLPHSVASCLLFPVALWYWHGLAIGFGGSFVGTYYGIGSLLYHLLCSSSMSEIQAVLDTVHVTVFGQSNFVSAGAMADTFFDELRIGCRFSTGFCAHHENQTNIFWELPVQYQGKLFAKSQWQVSIFCINFSQWKSHYVENVCLSSTLDMSAACHEPYFFPVRNFSVARKIRYTDTSLKRGVSRPKNLSLFVLIC